MVNQQYEYEVVLSFAGEEREYVEAVATNLQSSGIKVFYDEFEKVELWGKDLYVYLDNVYRNKARFCVIFISENYRKKNWTNHERESAQARAFQENEEYILPARFDNTEIPGVRPTVGYISLKNYTPKKFATLIIEKLNSTHLTALKSPNFSSEASYLEKTIVKAANISEQKLQQSKTLNLAKSSSKSNCPKSSKKAVKNDRSKPRQTAFSKKRVSNNYKYAKFKTKTVDLTLEGIAQLPNDKPIVYKILTEGRKNNYTGIAKRGKIHATLKQHLQGRKSYIPGYKVFVERMKSIQEAQEKADRIVKISKPKYNELANN